MAPGMMVWGGGHVCSLVPRPTCTFHFSVKGAESLGTRLVCMYNLSDLAKTFCI